MNRMVDKGKTLLVDGPASVTISSGKAEVFGTTLSCGGRVVIREGKRLPFAVQETAAFDIALAENATAEEVEGNTLPSSWVSSAEEFLGLQAKPLTALVLGAVDSGKTGFCTYLVNRCLGEKKKVSVLDGDLGQSDVGPPSTVAYASVAKPLTDLFNLQARNAVFIGDTSPGSVADKMVEGLILLKKEAMANNPDLIVINTDGWTEGVDAVNYKLRLAETVRPDTVFCVRQGNELTPIVDALGEFRIIFVDSPPAIRQRDSERRRTLRELGYKKYLRNPRVRSMSLSWLRIEGNESFALNRNYVNMREAMRINEMLGMKPLQLTETKDRISIVIGRRRWISSDGIRKVEESTRKRVVVTKKGEEQGLLAGLYNNDRRFLGIGVLQEIDYLRRTVKIRTPVSKEASVLAIGRVRLDKNMKEIPIAEENNMDSSF